MDSIQVADTTKEPNLLKHRDVKNAILAQARRVLKEKKKLHYINPHLMIIILNAILIQAGRTAKEGEVQVKQLSICQKNMLKCLNLIY